MQLSNRIITRVAHKEGAEPAELEPLAQSIEPEALDRIFDSDGNLMTQEHGIVVFSYLDYTITVTSDGEIRVD